MLTAPSQVLVKSRPIFANPVNINWYNVDEALHNEAAIKNIAWVATRLSNLNEQKIPFWPGFNQSVSENSSK